MGESRNQEMPMIPGFRLFPECRKIAKSLFSDILLKGAGRHEIGGDRGFDAARGEGVPFREA
jgi:hypothetical protein